MISDIFHNPILFSYFSFLSLGISFFPLAIRKTIKNETVLCSPSITCHWYAFSFWGIQFLSVLFQFQKAYSWKSEILKLKAKMNFFLEVTKKRKYKCLALQFLDPIWFEFIAFQFDFFFQDSISSFRDFLCINFFVFDLIVKRKEKNYYSTVGQNQQRFGRKLTWQAEKKCFRPFTSWQCRGHRWWKKITNGLKKLVV